MKERMMLEIIISELFVRFSKTVVKIFRFNISDSITRTFMKVNYSGVPATLCNVIFLTQTVCSIRCTQTLPFEKKWLWLES